MSLTRTFRGVGVCSGIAFGRVHLVDRRRVTVPHYHVAHGDREREKERFERAVGASMRQLEELEQRASKSGLSQVEALLSAHGMILRDAALRDTTIQRILDDGQNAEWALKDTVAQIKGLFERLEEDYFRERRSDVDIVGDRVLRNLVGEATDLLDHVSDDAIIVAYDLSPADTVALAKFAALAFVTEHGGRTSHTAILARALDVPCVLSTEGIMRHAGSGDELIVDGERGEVVLRPSVETTAAYEALARRRREEAEVLLADRDTLAQTRDGQRVTLLGNVEVSPEVQPLLEKGAEGIGLYRTEFLRIEEPDLNGAEAHTRVYRRVIEAMGGLEVTIRTFDEGGDKSFADVNAIQTANEMLGQRAIRRSLADPDVFGEQLEGILAASRYGPVKLLLPFVTSVDEVRHARRLIEEARARVEARDGPLAQPVPVGVMIETPAAAMIVDHLLHEVDFISVGTNDLLQFVLAADRSDDELNARYGVTHPAVLRILANIVASARAAKKPVTLCGEIAGDPNRAPLLIGLGFERLSMTGGSIPLVKRALRSVDASVCRAAVLEACGLPTARDVEACLAEHGL
ncbi:MAG: phosphoenolpyruvate--protein phosphotransferase [Deltaproteobacteria bacterium]